MKRAVLSGVILVFLLSACGLIQSQQNEPTVDIQAAIEQTMAIQNAASTMVAQTLAAANAQVAQNQAPVVYNTPIPPTPTAEPTVSVKATASKNANCRSGPASNFDLLGTLSQGASADVIGKNSDFGQWWKVRLADGTECWVTEDAISLAGDTSIVAAVTSPKTPTPIPAPDWNGTWNLWISGTFENKSDDISMITVKMVQTGNQLTYSFTIWGLHFTAYLTVSADGMSASGSLVRQEGGTWSIQLFRVPGNLDQFRGKWYYGTDKSVDGENCGSRNGEPKPNPCRQ